MARATILIASNAKDRPNYESVLVSLERRGCSVLVYDALAVMTAAAQFSITLRGSETRFMYNNLELDPLAIHAAWTRRATPSLPAKDNTSIARLDRERAASQNLLWDTIPEERWLNSPLNNKLAQRKMIQFTKARAAGLRLPATIISNNWREIIDTLPGDSVIFKMAESGRLFQDGRDQFVYTHVFPKKLTALPAGQLPLPGIWQEYVPKKREWRVVIVGERVFPVAIDTSAEAKDDWRRLQTDERHVRFSTGVFPAEISTQCQELMRVLRLRFGAFDFIETPTGEFVFLEVNPNGQFAWLIHHGLPIGEAIADELLAIAQTEK